jgi:aspartyl/glutamyl-tRNA(Asn/Gln) amidotransferase C subunit
MAVTRGDILHIAALAELAVDDATVAQLEGQLTHILDYVRQLEALGDGAEPVADLRAVRLRPDTVGADPLLRSPQAFGCVMQQGLFVVPRLGALGGGEEAP